MILRRFRMSYKKLQTLYQAWHMISLKACGSHLPRVKSPCSFWGKPQTHLDTFGSSFNSPHSCSHEQANRYLNENQLVRVSTVSAVRVSLA